MTKKKTKKSISATKPLTWEEAIHDIVSERGAALGRDIALRAALLVQLRLHVGPGVAPRDLTPRQVRTFLRAVPASLAGTARETVRDLLVVAQVEGAR